MKALVINANREGYAIDQLWGTMTVGQLISLLEMVADKDLPVVIGNDYEGETLGWYTYGSLNEEDFTEFEEEDEDEDEEDEDSEEE